MSLVSLARLASANSCEARALTMPRRAPTNGSSNTSVDGKRPAVDPGSVQTMSTTPSLAWS